MTTIVPARPTAPMINSHVHRTGVFPTRSMPALRRRLSYEEDNFYQKIALVRIPSQPPQYDDIATDKIIEPMTPSDVKTGPASLEASPSARRSSKDEKTRKRKPTSGIGKVDDAIVETAIKAKSKKGAKTPKPAIVPLDFGKVQDALPFYYCDIHVEGVFQMKCEITDAVRRAQNRSWDQVYVVLHGTALNVYSIKREWSFGKGRKAGPGVVTDNPPWLNQGKLERSYSLQHADVGIAADYQKRRYVIRLRAESDQFLLSCVELPNFVRWLEALFAAIDVAAPIDERDFPRDQSIPRMQRSRWMRSQRQARNSRRSNSAPNNSLAQIPEDHPPPVDVVLARPVLASMPEESEARQPHAATTESDTSSLAQPPSQPPPLGHDVEDDDLFQTQEGNHGTGYRLSNTSYPNSNLDYDSGKWAPTHRWTDTHDMIYAKLCYAVLLFRSPRKSNYVIMKGKQWLVDWKTGAMARVLPPGYDEPAFYGPWQIVHTENTRI